MEEKDLKKSCVKTKCNECPLDKTKYLCKIAIIFREFRGHSFNYVIEKLKEEIEKVEKEIK